MKRRHPREDREYAIYRAEMTAPDALALAIDEADEDGCERRAAEHEQRRRRILVHAYELPEDRRQRERDKRPATPA